MTILFSLFFFSKSSDFSSCLSSRTLTESFLCFASTLKPVESELYSEFMNCLTRCHKNPDKDNSECGHCTTHEKCSSEQCQKCILGCQNISDILHQEQCYSGCYRHNRINPLSDYGSRATTDCESFQMFYTELTLKETFLETELRTSIETMCSANLTVLPICYAIAKKRWSNAYEYLTTSTSAEQFCTKMGFNY